MISRAAAAIIAGGKATRLGGANKALLVCDGRPVIERQLDVLRPLFEKVIAVTGNPEPFVTRGISCFADLIPDKGAPGGVHSALVHAGAPWLFAVACDMPYLSAEAIERLADLREGYDAVVPVRDSRIEPLHAFYSTSCQGSFEKVLRSSDPSFVQLLAGAKKLLVEATRLGTTTTFLENVNDPADLQRLGLRLGEIPK